MNHTTILQFDDVSDQQCMSDMKTKNKYEFCDFPHYKVKSRMNHLEEKRKKISGEVNIDNFTQSVHINNMVNRAQGLYSQYKKNNLIKNKKLGTEDFGTIFSDYIPERDDDLYKKRKNQKVKEMLENSYQKPVNIAMDNSEKVYLTYCKDDPSKLNDAMDVLKHRYFGAFEQQEKKISKKLEEVLSNTNKIDHLVNNVNCKNPKINKKLGPIIQNFFVVYQREQIEQLVDDIVDEEVKTFNEIEALKEENSEILKNAELKGDLATKLEEQGFDNVLDILFELEKYKNDFCE